MSSTAQRVLVIQDASIELSVHAIKWAVQGLSLQPGDKMMLLRVVELNVTANASPCMGCGILGYSIRLHPSVTIRRKQDSIDKLTKKMLNEDQKNDEIQNVFELIKLQQIDIKSEVEAGHPLKQVAVKAATDFGATCVILNRKLKKDEKYIADNLTCGIIRMKHNGDVEYVRAPDEIETDDATPPDRGGEQQNHNSICSICMNRRPRVGIVREFSYGELQFSTDGFSKQNLLSPNRKIFYKGILSDGTRVVVRRHTLKTVTDMEFNIRVQMLATARHDNVALLLGAHSQGPERLLVYEYACNSSLNTHLAYRNTTLTWERRMKIAMGAARGLQYLHSKNLYGNIRPNNILLTHDYNPLLTNYGVTKNQYEDLGRSSSSRALRTFDYLAPEYEETGTDSSITDIYSFGVVLLELITGRKTTEETQGQSFLRWARPLLREKYYPGLIDPTLESHDIHQLFWMVRIAERCLMLDPHKRLSVNQLVNFLEYNVTLGNATSHLALTPSEADELITSL